MAPLIESPSQLGQPPSRVVSLAPALTETLFDLGIGDALVGVSDDCRRPDGSRVDLPRLGPPGEIDLAAAAALEPDLVLAHRWPAPAEGWVPLAGADLRVWAPELKSVRAVIDMLWAMSRLFGRSETGLRVGALERTLEWTAMAAQAHEPVPTLCLLDVGAPRAAQDTWLTAGANTYVSDLLAVCGGGNVFAGRATGSGNGADPALADGSIYATLDELTRTTSQVILLAAHLQPAAREPLLEQLGEQPAVHSGRVHVMEAATLTWPGTRLAHALRELPPLLYP